jgi:predicted RNA-binding Zn ribbon-like protein
MTQASSRTSPRPRGLFLAGHPALDFLNTRMRVKGETVDVLREDEDVRHWLGQVGFPVPKTVAKVRPTSLLNAALKLRENVRALVEARKAGRRGSVAVLNSFLEAGPSHPKLIWNAPRAVSVERIRRSGSAEAILAPVAESAAKLLATGNFALVKHCEDETCVLWFLDQTKAYRRRWCSMTLCGNRNKVAAYRKRAHQDRKGKGSSGQNGPPRRKDGSKTSQWLHRSM